MCSVPTGPEIQVPPELLPPPTSAHRAPPWGRPMRGAPTLKQSPSASSEKMAREVGYRMRSRSHCSWRGSKVKVEARLACTHSPPWPPHPCPQPTCEGRCCSLTLEAQMALPTAGRPNTVCSRLSLCCRVPGSSSSGGPW